MIEIKNGKHKLEMRFGLGQLNAIDNALGIKVDDRVALGEGLTQLVPKLENGSLIAISKVIRATTQNQAHSPKNDEEVEEMMKEIIKEYGSLKKFGEAIIEDMGKNVLTQEVLKQAKENQAKEI